jgi:hypothetical protein
VRFMRSGVKDLCLARQQRPPVISVRYQARLEEEYLAAQEEDGNRLSGS